MPSDKINGPALRAIRERSDLTIEKFATLITDSGCPVKPSHISNIEAGRRGASVELTKMMARVLRVPRLALLRDHDERAA